MLSSASTTADLAATHDFYVGTLGLTLARDQETCHIYAVAGGSFLGFCERGSVALPPSVVLTLVTENVDGVYERLMAAGVTAVAAPKHNAEYGIYHFYAQRPNGESGNSAVSVLDNFTFSSSRSAESLI